MATFDPNDSQYDGNGGFEKVAPGAHLLAIKEAKLKTSNSGNKMIEVTFVVVGDDPNKGLTVPWQYFVTTEKAIWRLADMCRACSPNVNPFDTDNQGDINRELVGKVLVGVVEHRESAYKGVTKTKVDVASYRVPSSKAMERLGDFSISAAPAAGPAKPAQVAADDIPF